jgi:nucleoside-specific outer membrane channel protein Tsx
MYRYILAYCVMACFFVPSAKAEDFIKWQSSNIQLLRGHDFELGERDRTLITLEHAHGHEYGDTYAWIDLIKPDGQTWQVTIAWNKPFEIGAIKFLAEGFTDLQGSEGGRKPNQLVVPRFLVDIGDLARHSPEKLMAGIEYQYWHNKFGVGGVTESVPQAQVKWTF